MSYYYPHEVNPSAKMKKKVQSAINQKKALSLYLKNNELVGDKTLLLTKRQISKIKRAAQDTKKRRGVLLHLSKRQLKANVKYKGGFLSLLAGLAARVLPTLLGGLATGVVSGAIEKAMSKGGDGLYLHKQGHCYQIQKTEGDGLFLRPHQPLHEISGDGIFLRHGSNIYDGSGIILGKNSPFKNIPILGWIL